MKENIFNIKRVCLKNNPNATYDLYMGRENSWRGLAGSKWQNPFVMKNEGDRARVLSEYKMYIIFERNDLYRSLDELKNKVLACWCSENKKCHIDILIELLEEKEKKS